MGFQPDLQRIVRVLNPDRQTLLFSATMADGIRTIARAFLKDPVQINIAISKPAEGVKQGAYVLYNDQKVPVIVDLLQNPDRLTQSIIVFSSSKQMVVTLFNQLKRKNLNVGMISSDLEQKDRERVMMDFRNRKINILVATDVISRGIDIDGIDLIINFDAPRDAEDYVHRIGRTARAERKGEAITLIGPDDQPKFARIEKLIGMVIEKRVVDPTFGPVPEYKGNHQGKSRSKPNFRKNRGKSQSGQDKRPNR
jgi:superfamily II DNA/RNA helicase